MANKLHHIKIKKQGRSSLLLYKGLAER